MEIKCNCSKEWPEKCKKRVTDWMVQYGKLEMYPAQYLFYYHEYRAKGIISETKNDKVFIHLFNRQWYPRRKFMLFRNS